MRSNPDHPKYSEKERETMQKELAKTISEAEAKALAFLGVKPGDTLEMKHRKVAGSHWQIAFDDLKKALEPYTLDFVAELAKGDPDEPLDAFKEKLRGLAQLYIEQGRKVVSFWTRAPARSASPASPRPAAPRARSAPSPTASLRT